MMYQFLKAVLSVTLRVFFKQINIVGKENLRVDGPVILVANHPNTFMDPLLIATFTRQRVGFLANGSLFRNPILARVFNFFQMIPIYRRVDIRPGEKQDNKDAFRKCHAYLEKGKTLLVFPEGTSHHELKLREIKTGTARIALSYEAIKNFEGKLKILPVSLDYSNAIEFRSIVSIHVQRPLELTNYREMYSANEAATIKALTQEIKRQLLKNIPQTENKEEEAFLIEAHKFYTTFSDTSAGLYKDGEKSLNYRREIAKILQTLATDNQKQYTALKKEINEFSKAITESKLSMGMLKEKNPSKSLLAIYGLGLLVCMPIYLYGLLLNYIPYLLPSIVFKKSGLDISYKAPVQMIVGLIVFPVCYLGYFILFKKFYSEDLSLLIIFLISIPLSGIIAIAYYRYLNRFRKLWRFVFVVSASTKKHLYELRDQLIESVLQLQKR